MTTNNVVEPALASPDFDGLVDRHGLVMLQARGSLTLIDGDIATTKDGDIRLGDIPFSALYRLVEHWRHNAPHLHHLYLLAEMMLSRRVEALKRLDRAAEITATRIADSGHIEHSPEFFAAWHAHWNEEGAAVFGNQTYAGCLILLASSALIRFRDDLDPTEAEWRSCGQRFGGHSTGEVIVAAANGFRHEDEWAKTRKPTSRQKFSQDVLADALGPQIIGQDNPPPGRCPEVLKLLARDGGFDGFAGAILSFAHEVAQSRRTALRTTR